MGATYRILARRIASTALVLLLAFAPLESATAESHGPPWLRIQSTQVEPSVFEGYAKVSFQVSAISLEGVFFDNITGKNAWSLMVGKKKQKLPYIAGQFHALSDEVAIAIVIDTSPDFADVLPAIKESVAAFINSLPAKRSQVAMIHFDDRVHGSKRVRSPKRALTKLGRLEANLDPGDKLLLDAVERGRRAVYRAKPLTKGATLRKLIIVISDGRDVEYPNPRTYRKIAKKASKNKIPIHTVAYAPDGNRLPLRGLAELSKRSEGTFRFNRIKSSFKSHFAQLGNEVSNQYVITFYVPAKDIKGKKLGLFTSVKDMTSTTQERVQKPKCGDQSCDGGYCVSGACIERSANSGRGIVGWILLIGGIALGGLVALIILGFILTKLSNRSARPPAEYPPGAMPGTHDAPVDDAPPGPHRVAAQGPVGGYGQQPPPGRVAPTGAHGQVAPQMPHTGQQQRIQPTGAHGATSRQSSHRPPGQAYRAPVPVLLIIEGPYQGQRIPLQHGFKIGKTPDCQLNLSSDRAVSSHHAHIEMDTRGTCTLVDERSTNGTYINGVRTTKKQLSHGMLIQIGSAKMRFLAQ